MAVDPAKNRKALENYIQAWGTNDKALLLAQFAPDGILEDPVGTPAFKGHEGIGKFWDFAHQDSSRTMTPVLEEIRTCGNQAIMCFTMQVRLPNENQGLNLSIIEHIDFDDQGRIQHLRAFWDETSVSKPDGMELFVPDISEAYEG